MKRSDRRSWSSSRVLPALRRRPRATSSPGRPLFAGHAALPWPDEPHLVLWHAQTLLREYRGDGHVALLRADGLSGIEALVVHGATGDVPQRSPCSRVARGPTTTGPRRSTVCSSGAISTPTDRFTEAGRARRQRIEDQTDALRGARVRGTDRRRRGAARATRPSLQSHGDRCRSAADGRGDANGRRRGPVAFACAQGALVPPDRRRRARRAARRGRPAPARARRSPISRRSRPRATRSGSTGCSRRAAPAARTRGSRPRRCSRSRGG